MAALKGQNLRVFVDNAVVGEATACVITLTNNTEDASTKNDTGMAANPVVSSKSWQVQVDSLNVSDVGTFLTAIKNATVFTLKWDETSISDNTTPQSAAFSRHGSAYLSDATFVFNDREYATKQLTFIGTGSIS